jgi:hypothetical protein
MQGLRGAVGHILVVQVGRGGVKRPLPAPDSEREESRAGQGWALAQDRAGRGATHPSLPADAVRAYTCLPSGPHVAVYCLISHTHTPPLACACFYPGLGHHPDTLSRLF